MVNQRRVGRRLDGTGRTAWKQDPEAAERSFAEIMSAYQRTSRVVGRAEGESSRGDPHVVGVRDHCGGAGLRDLRVLRPHRFRDAAAEPQDGPHRRKHVQQLRRHSAQTAPTGQAARRSTDRRRGQLGGRCPTTQSAYRGSHGR